MENNNSNQALFLWDAPIRYFEKKPPTFGKSLIALGILFSLIAYFIGEPFLVLVVWMVVFVSYVKITIPPPNTQYSVTTFGIHISETIIEYKHIHSFAYEIKKEGSVLRFYLTITGQPFFVILPMPFLKTTELLTFLKSQLPYLERVPKTDAERFTEWAGKTIGLT